MRRIAFFFAIRRCSLLEMNQRLLRMVLKMPLLTIFLRKRLSRESWDSPLRKFTEANEITCFPYGNKKLGLRTESAEEMENARNELNDRVIKKCASQLLDLQTWIISIIHAETATEIIHDSHTDEQMPRGAIIEDHPGPMPEAGCSRRTGVAATPRYCQIRQL